jgi:hypothetical protein
MNAPSRVIGTAKPPPDVLKVGGLEGDSTGLDTACGVTDWGLDEFGVDGWGPPMLVGTPVGCSICGLNGCATPSQ